MRDFPNVVFSVASTDVRGFNHIVYDVHLRDSPTLVYARLAPRGPTVTHKVLSALGRPGLPRHNALTVLLRLPQIRI
ncbi:hypothetical protein ACOSQ3_029564 [Xanthoceras sorbifolium]